ncbi:Cilia- and flagella-associated protein 58 [Aduncisulcus paluster]|uniref:Cilia- and flagella-associated protein 58 n=1 Tax=Aduncisulcus paluster TaxID=2918883 RepID=A0ABQ5KQ51_9EUKA|nr:Cilia- and flagella-associated protein 58 [Aduncisulcus paluster]
MDDKKKDSLDLEQMEREFTELLNELGSGAETEVIATEFLRVFTALKKSHENEKVLIAQVKKLREKIAASSDTVTKVRDFTDGENETVFTLKAELDKAYSLLARTRAQEAQSKDVIEQLKGEIAALTKLAERGSAVSVEGGARIEELQRERDTLIRERDVLNDQITTLRSEAVDLVTRARGLEKEKLEADRKVRALRDMVLQSHSEVETESKRKERLEEEIQKQRQLLENQEKDSVKKDEEIESLKSQITTLKSEIVDSRRGKEKTDTEVSRLESRIAKLKQELHDQTQLAAQSAAQTSEVRQVIAQKDVEITKSRDELQKSKRQVSQHVAQIEQLRRQQSEITTRRDKLKEEVLHLNADIDTLRRGVESDRRMMEHFKQEKSLLMRKLRDASGGTKDVQDTLDVAEMEKKNLEQEVLSFKEEAQKQRRIIFTLEREREQHASAAVKSNQQYLQTVQIVKMRDVTISDLQKKVTESESRLKQQQQLYEAVRADRNIYSKNLIQSQDEITEMKRKFKIMSHSIDQLREEIETKDVALVRETGEKRKIEKEKEQHKSELQTLKRDIERAESIISKQRADISKLNAIIAEADSERERQQKDLQVMMNERDILGTQLIRRNDELELLYEKIRIQQATLKRGEKEYAARVQDIRHLRNRMQNLERETSALRRATQDMTAFKREVIKLQSDLITEKARTKALSDELENPMNVHRWRRLEGSDPASYEMIQKIQQLQKRLISKTEEVAEKDLLIEEKEKLYLELKRILARQPGPEIVEQVSSYQKIVREKTRQLKTLAAELTMYQTQVQDYKVEIERLTAELHNVKQKYFDTRRREQRILEVQKLMEEEEKKRLGVVEARYPLQHLGPQTAIHVAGGFNVAMRQGRERSERRGELAGIGISGEEMLELEAEIEGVGMDIEGDRMVDNPK